MSSDQCFVGKRLDELFRNKCVGFEVDFFDDLVRGRRVENILFDWNVLVVERVDEAERLDVFGK